MTWTPLDTGRAAAAEAGVYDVAVDHVRRQISSMEESKDNYETALRNSIKGPLRTVDQEFAERATRAIENLESGIEMLYSKLDDLGVGPIESLRSDYLALLPVVASCSTKHKTDGSLWVHGRVYYMVCHEFPLSSDSRRYLPSGHELRWSPSAGVSTDEVLVGEYTATREMFYIPPPVIPVSVESVVAYSDLRRAGRSASAATMAVAGSLGIVLPARRTGRPRTAHR